MYVLCIQVNKLFHEIKGDRDGKSAVHQKTAYSAVVVNYPGQKAHRLSARSRFMWRLRSLVNQPYFGGRNTSGHTHTTLRAGRNVGLRYNLTTSMQSTQSICISLT